MTSDSVNPYYIRKGRIGEMIYDNVSDRLSYALNRYGKIRFFSRGILNQDGNGRGNEGKSLDRISFVLYDDGYHSGYVLRGTEIKNWSRYRVSPTTYYEKILKKFNDLNIPDKTVDGSCNINREWLKEEGITLNDIGHDVEPDTPRDKIWIYEEKLTCEIVQDLDMKYPNLLDGQFTDYEISFVDNCTIELLKSGKVDYRINVAVIKPCEPVYVGPEIADFFQVWRDGDYNILGCPWVRYRHKHDIEVGENDNGSKLFHSFKWREN